jgi:hypothetical protein
MKETLTELALLLSSTPKRLVDIADADAEQRPASGGWSKKEILGHLIDSVSNNHQRFVRGQMVPHLDYPSYDQNAWVSAEAFNSAAWPDLVNLWLLYNRHFLHILRHLPEAAQNHTISIGGKSPVTLASLAADYLTHTKHHLGQILPR